MRRGRNTEHCGARVGRAGAHEMLAAGDSRFMITLCTITYHAGNFVLARRPKSFPHPGELKANARILAWHTEQPEVRATYTQRRTAKLLGLDEEMM